MIKLVVLWYISLGEKMAQCTAPVNGHRSAAAQAACPACGGRSRSFSYSYPSYSSRTSFSTYENKYKKEHNGPLLVLA